MTSMSEEVVIEALIALDFIVQPIDGSSKLYLQNLDAVVDMAGKQLTRLLRTPSIYAPNTRIATKACSIITVLCRSPYCRTELIQTGLIPDLIYQTRDVEPDDPRAGIPEWYKSQLEEILVIVDDAFKVEEDTYNEEDDVQGML